MKDAAGNDIKKGSKVGFARRKGSVASIVLGEVVDDEVLAHSGTRKGLSIKTRGGALVYKNGHEVLVWG